MVKQRRQRIITLSGLGRLASLLILIFSGLNGQQPAPDKVIFGTITVLAVDSTHFDLAGIETHYATQPVNDATYKSLTKAIMSAVLQEGFLYPVLALSVIQPVERDSLTAINPVFRLDPGEKVIIDTVIYEGAERTSPELLCRESVVLIGQTPDTKKISTYLENFKNYPFLSIKSQPEIVKTRAGTFGLLVQVAEHSTNVFSGAVGYVPPTGTTKGYVTGEVEINLNNISGRGRRLNVYWSKPNRNSQQIDLSYYEPWILKTNYSATGRFSQVLRDTLAVIRELDIGFGRRMSRRGSASLNLNYTATMPTAGGRELLGLTDISTRGIGINIKYDSRDNPANPRRGILLGGNTYISRRTEDDKRLWQDKFGVNGEAVLSLRPQFVAACIWNYRGQWLSEGVPVYSDYYWLGGARTLRGYANDLFGGSEVAGMNYELRWLISKNGRMHLFFDQGYYRLPVAGADGRSYPHSYGIGLRLDSRMGIIGLDYGFGRGDTFSTAKIHVFLETNF